MQVNFSQPNFGARVKIKPEMKNVTEFGPLKDMKAKLENSGTANVYELGKYTTIDKRNGVHEVLLNGVKFDEVTHKDSDGYFGVAKKFLQKSLDKEDSILAEINPEILSKLNKIREFIKNTGITIENAKKWL